MIFRFVLTLLTVNKYESYADKIFCNFDDIVDVFSGPQGYGCDVQSIELSSDSKNILFGEHQADKLNTNVKVVNRRGSGFQLTNLDETFCESFENLETIFFSSVIVNGLQENSLKKCIKLKNFVLDSAGISEIPENLLLNNNELRKSSFYGNNIKEIPKNLFRNKAKLDVLLLASNQITKLPKGVFKDLKNLRKLWMWKNHLTSLSSESFGLHPHLTEVILWGNKIVAIDERFIDNSAVGWLNLRLNVCYGDTITVKAEMKPKLKMCFENFRLMDVENDSTTEASDAPTTSRTILQQRPTPSTTPTITNSRPSCGVSRLSGKGNVIGGSQITRGDFPWQAALTSNGMFFCGGTLIDHQRVITAAHCLQEKGESARKLERHVQVKLGVYDLSMFTSGLIIASVYKIHLHPDWNPENYRRKRYDADIAILILADRVHFDNYIQPLCLISRDMEDSIVTVKVGLVAGFGKSEDATKLHEDIARVLELPMHDTLECVLNYPDLASLSSERTFCAGHANGTGVCTGDSGSGYIVKYKGAYYLRGIVSSSAFSDGVCDVFQYSVFTNVLNYTDWINGIGFV